MSSPHPAPLRRQILPGIVLCALLLVFLGETYRAAAQQQTDTLDLKAQPGFDGYCKRDEWLPVRVQVENKGSDLKAVLQVSYKKGSEGKSSTRMNVELPATSRKEFFLYIYYSEAYGQSLNVSLLTKSKVLKQVDLAMNCLAPDNMVFGVLADNPSTFDLLGDIKPLRGNVRIAQLKPADLPGQAQAWAALDALVVSNVDTGVLTPAQRQALKSWVSSGGKLLVTGGLSWQSTTAGLQDLLPVELQTTSHVTSLSGLRSYVRDPIGLEADAILARGRLRPGAQVLVSQDNIPLLVEQPAGFGSVYFLAADPALQPLSGWPGMANVYQHLLASQVPLPAWAGGSWYSYRANEALATIPELGLPSIVYICCLMGFYILIIGPLNYVALRRVKRRELAWLTIPVLVFLFTCLSYGTGYLYRGVTPILNRVAVAQAWDGMERAEVHALVGVYSPMRARYDLQASDGFFFRPLQQTPGNLQAGNTWSSLQEDQSMIMPAVPVEIGGMETVMADGSIPALKIRHTLVLSLSKINPVLAGTITNQSQYTLKDAFLVTSGGWTQIGTLGPGESKPVRVSLAVGPNGPAFYSLDSARILGVNYQDLQTDLMVRRRSALLDAILFPEYGVGRGNWGVYLMGWVEDLKLPAGLKDKRFKAIDTMFYVDQLSPEVRNEQGELRLPPSMFVWEASVVNGTPYYLPEVPPAGVVLRFQPAVPVSSASIKSITLYLTGNAPYQSLVVSAWDYEEKSWVRLTVTGSYTELTEPQRFVGPDGEMMLKFQNSRSDRVELNGSYITVVVQP